LLCLMLAKNTSLERLEIHDYPLNADLLSFLIENKTLKYLRCLVVVGDMPRIAKILELNKCLEILDIPNNRLEASQINAVESVKNVKIYYNNDRV
jgi:hypothetical protein